MEKICKRKSVRNRDKRRINYKEGQVDTLDEGCQPSGNDLYVSKIKVKTSQLLNNDKKKQSLEGKYLEKKMNI